MVPAVLAFLQIQAVIAAIELRAADSHFQQGIAGVVKKIAVVRHDDGCAFPLAEVALEPFDRLNIKMIGRLIEQQQIGVGKQQPRQVGACALPAGEMIQ